MLANLDFGTMLLALAFGGSLLVLFFLKDKLTPKNTPINLNKHIARSFGRALMFVILLFVTLLIVSLFI